MKIAKSIVSIILFIAISALAFQVITQAHENQKRKKDYAELNNFKYGLFSVDAWKEQLAIIITSEIDKLYLTRKNEKTLHSHLETQLGILIDKIDQRIRKNSKSALKQSIMDAFVDVEDIKKGIPEYADAIMAEMTASKTEGQIKSMLKSKINSYMEKTFDVSENNKKEEIILKSGAYFEEAAKEVITKKIGRTNDLIVELAAIMIGLAILLFAMEAFSRGPLPQTQYIILTLTLIVLLTTGVTTPMIDMEAKISELNFVLFDHPIRFENQVLYFQSKSIIDVFWIMIKHSELQMNAAGLLMVGFSIVFPLLKMISSLCYYYNYCRAREYRLINWFVLKSGKWSMADVMVVAIFMSFIGFNGILNTQLGNLKKFSDEIGILTTNGTSLQPGFYVFLTYTVLAMFLSGFLKYRPRDCELPQAKA